MSFEYTTAGGAPAPGVGSNLPPAIQKILGQLRQAFGWEGAAVPVGGPTAAGPAVLMVCTGNICRSQMAHLVLLDEASAAGVALGVGSAGVSAEEQGNPIDRRAAQVLTGAGYRKGSHRAHRVEDAELQQADLVLAMTSRHFEILQSRGEQAGISWGQAGAPRLEMYNLFSKLSLLSLAGALPEDGALPPAASYSLWGAERGLWRLRDLDVPDPWYGGMQDFLETLQTITEATPHLLTLVAGK